MGSLLFYACSNRVYLIDFSAVEEIVSGDTITSATVAATPTGLTFGPAVATNSGTTVSFRMSGGTAGVSYLITVSANMASGSVVCTEIDGVCLS